MNLKKLPDGKVRIHLLVADQAGAIRVRGASHGPVDFPGNRFRVACDPKAGWLPPNPKNQSHGFSGDARAVTCPECLNTDAARAFLAAHPDEEG